MDREAFERTMLPERGRLLAYLAGMIGDREAALDLAQEAFLAAWRAFGSFRGESEARTWLIGIARRIAARAERRGARRARLLAAAGADGRLAPGAAADAAGANVAADARPSALDAIVAAEREARARRAVLDLPRERREAIVLRYFVGMSVAEIARATAVSEGTVKSRLARAREALARSLAEEIEA